MQFKDLKVGDDFLTIAGLNYKKTGDKKASYDGLDSFIFSGDELVQSIKWQNKKCTSDSHFRPISLRHSNTCNCGATFEVV